MDILGVTIESCIVFACIIVLFALLSAVRKLWLSALISLIFGLAYFLRYLYFANVASNAPAWIVLSSLEALSIALTGILYTFITVRVLKRRVNIQSALIFATVFVAVEELRSIIPYGGFPIARIGLLQVPKSFENLAFLGGAPLISFAVVFVACMVFVALHAVATGFGKGAVRYDVVGETKWDGATVSHGAFRVFGLLIVMAIVSVGGLFLPVGEAYFTSTDTFTFGAVQGNIDEEALKKDNKIDDTFINHVNVTKNQLQQAKQQYLQHHTDVNNLDIIFLPENSLDYDPKYYKDIRDQLNALVDEQNAPIMIGINDFLGQDGITKRYNKMLLWTADSGGVIGNMQWYAKRHPVPFGEYVPDREIWRSLSDQIDRIKTDMLPSPSNDVGIFKVPAQSRNKPAQTGNSSAGNAENSVREAKIGALICFEIFYDEYIAELANSDAEFIVLPTNNISFGTSDESAQQLQASKIAAIASGRAVLQISTVGTSALALPNGDILHQTALMQPAAFVDSVNLTATPTPAATILPYLRYALFVMVVAMGIIALAKGRDGLGVVEM
ncbi:MAG: apolipoprotein N-acyltransferase [Bifidobacteriaceae bacterium]|jgi:apolipoprotein N-acyltransferase|nr:apolipoprotein N-acyltransferase [Bifidobacteriaceae bacterium]